MTILSIEYEQGGCLRYNRCQQLFTHYFVTLFYSIDLKETQRWYQIICNIHKEMKSSLWKSPCHVNCFLFFSFKYANVNRITIYVIFHFRQSIFRWFDLLPLLFSTFDIFVIKLLLCLFFPLCSLVLSALKLKTTKKIASCKQSFSCLVSMLSFALLAFGVLIKKNICI